MVMDANLIIVPEGLIVLVYLRVVETFTMLLLVPVVTSKL
jgi:hypothetical protein